MLFGAVQTQVYQNFPKWHQCQPVLQCQDDRQIQPSSATDQKDIARAAGVAGELPRGEERRPLCHRRRDIHDEGGSRGRGAGIVTGTVTGSTGAEVIALGTIIGIIGAAAAKATKPG
jgi:hypothetical protein